MFSRYFRMPNGFENFVYLSQVQQAVAIKTAVEYWRHLRPTCMGTLYWQLNDVWPVCSWASVEYGGNWKLLHYAARRFYQPVLLTCFQKENELQVWLVNDHPDQDMTVNAVLQVRDFSGTIMFEETIDHSAPAGAAHLVKKYEVPELTAEPAAGFLEMTLQANGETIARNTHFFTEYKRCTLQAPNIEVRVSDGVDGPSVALSAARPAFFVSLFAEGLDGTFSDNCITLVPGEQRVLTFQGSDSIGAPELEKALTLYHLRGTYA